MTKHLLGRTQIYTDSQTKNSKIDQEKNISLLFDEVNIGELNSFFIRKGLDKTSGFRNLIKLLKKYNIKNLLKKSKY